MASSVFQHIAAQAAEPLAALAVAAFTWVCAWGARWIASHTKNEKIRAGIFRLDDAVTAAVGEVQQTVVDVIKQQTKDGKLSMEDAAAVRTAAIGTIKAHFGIKGLSELQKTMGLSEADLISMLTARIEAAVQKSRNT